MKSKHFITTLSGILIISFFVTGCPNLVVNPGKSIGLSLVADGLTSPVGMAFPHDTSERIFIVNQTGKIRTI